MKCSGRTEELLVFGGSTVGAAFGGQHIFGVRTSWVILATLVSNLNKYMLQLSFN